METENSELKPRINTPMALKGPKDLHMFLPEKLGSVRIGNFMKMKYSVLSTLISQRAGKQQNESTCLFFTTGDFVNLLEAILNAQPSDHPKGLRIYFATYQRIDSGPNSNNNLIPYGMEDKLTLVFAPTLDDVDTGDYFIKDPDGKIINLTSITDDGEIASRWVQYYNTLKWPLLNSILKEVEQPNDETRCIFYAKDAINELYTWLTNNDLSSPSQDLPDAVTIFFGTYHLDDPYPATNPYPYTSSAGKLTLVIAFMNKYTYNGGDYYYYENESKYDNPLLLLGGQGDTGVPCPPPKCPPGAKLL